MYFDDVTTNEELIEKYRKLQKKYHPDNFQDEEEIEKNTKIFQEIGEEYKLKVEELLQEEFKKIEKKHKAPGIVEMAKNFKKNLSPEHREILTTSTKNISEELGRTVGRIGGEKLGASLSKLFWGA
jgi:curved DNA-binding protein CbpA